MGVTVVIKTLPEAQRANLSKEKTKKAIYPTLNNLEGFKKVDRLNNDMKNKIMFNYKDLRIIYGLRVTYRNGLRYEFMPYVVGVKQSFKGFNLNSEKKIIGIRKCSLCSKEIGVYLDKFGNKGWHKALCSDEGVLYCNSWFCLRCGKIINSCNTLKFVGGNKV